jgi:hypothetical protein
MNRAAQASGGLFPRKAGFRIGGRVVDIITSTSPAAAGNRA